MKRVLVVANLDLATSKELNNLADKELGVFGLDVDNVWKPVSSATEAKQIAFGVGQAGTVNNIITPLIIRDVRNASVTVGTYVADVKPTAQVVAAVSGFTARPMDMTNLKVEFFDTHSPDKDIIEYFTVTGSYSTPALIHTAIAAKVNKSKYFTAVANGSGGADNVVITAPSTGRIQVTAWFENDPNSSGVVTPLYTVTYPTTSVEGVGTKEKAQWLVDSLIGENGQVETMSRYDRRELPQTVTAERNTIVRFEYKEDKPTAATRDTDYLLNELTFIIDTPASGATTVVDDLVEFIEQVFLGVVPEEEEE